MLKKNKKKTKKEGFRGRCFYLFRIKEDKRRWGKKEGGAKKKWRRWKGEEQKKKERYKKKKEKT